MAEGARWLIEGGDQREVRPHTVKMRSVAEVISESLTRLRQSSVSDAATEALICIERLAGTKQGSLGTAGQAGGLPRVGPSLRQDASAQAESLKAILKDL